MSYEQLTLASLNDLDSGKAAECFQRLLKRAAEDCMDRPGDESKRTVTLKVLLSPVMDQDGDLSEVRTEIQCEAKFPAYRTKEYSMTVRKGGMVVYNPDSLGNANQKTFDMGDDAS